MRWNEGWGLEGVGSADPWPGESDWQIDLRQVFGPLGFAVERGSGGVAPLVRREPGGTVVISDVDGTTTISDRVPEVVFGWYPGSTWDDAPEEGDSIAFLWADVQPNPQAALERALATLRGAGGGGGTPYPTEPENVYTHGLFGLGDAAPRTRKKSLCVGDKQEMWWMRGNVCVNYRHRQGEGHFGAILSSRDVDRIFRAVLPTDSVGVELFGVMALNTKNVPIAVFEVHRGGTAQTIVDVPIVLQPVIMLGSSAFIVCHNHPSGSSQPSPEDIAMTDRLVRASTWAGVRMLDHVVIGSGTGQYFSFLDAGMMPKPPTMRMQ